MFYYPRFMNGKASTGCALLLGGAEDVKAMAGLGVLVGVILLLYAFSGVRAKKMGAWWVAVPFFFMTKKVAYLLDNDSSEKLRFPFAGEIGATTIHSAGLGTMRKVKVRKRNPETREAGRISASRYNLTVF